MHAPAHTAEQHREGGVPYDVPTGDELAGILPECGDVIITNGWVLEYELETEETALGTSVENGCNNTVRQENRQYLARIVSMAPHVASANVTAVVRYAREPVPCSSYPVGDSLDWNTFEGEEHRVSFSFKRTYNGVERSLCRVGDAGYGRIDWKPVSDTGLQELEAHVHRVVAVAQCNHNIKLVSDGLDKLSERALDMVRDITNLQAKVLEIVTPGNVLHDVVDE